ncbi:MAG: amidoligase family protein [Thermoguttaceae bacterium]|nr:amidoligase family protein [Thermoguttaceae bacterium]
MITANEIKFGVEIETIAPITLEETDGLNIGGYHSPKQVPFLPTGWKASRDGSIHTISGYAACEIVSPILCGADGLCQIEAVCEILTAKGFKVNRSTGVHVSVDWGRETDSETLSRLITMVSYCERSIYAITGTHAREQGCWCKSVHKYGNVKEAKKEMDTWIHEARYHLLNLTNLHNGQDRVEFRAFSGSLNATKICGWVQVCVGIVQKAKNAKKNSSWTMPKNADAIRKYHGGSESGHDLYRLRHFLGWFPYNEKNGTCCGLIEGCPITREAIVKEFERLVQKYESEGCEQYRYYRYC